MADNTCTRAAESPVVSQGRAITRHALNRTFVRTLGCPCAHTYER